MPGDEVQAAKKAADPPRVPPVQGFYDNSEIFFIHTEASDEKVAQMLTDMMDSPVILVPELAQVPPTSVANVFVFINGVEPEGARGRFGFQPDVFDSSPTEDDYSPLQRVTWFRGGTTPVHGSSPPSRSRRWRGRERLRSNGPASW